MLYLRSTLPIGIVIMILSLAGCSAPSTPTIPNQVTIIGPSIGYVGDQANFTAKVNFSSSALLLCEWKFDTSTCQATTAKQSWTFQQPGKHVIDVRVVRTGDNAILCSTTDTVTILAAAVGIIPDSLVAPLPLTAEFSLQFIHGKLPLNAEVEWQIDTSHFERSLANNMAALSYTFDSIGRHDVDATMLDSSGKVIASAHTVVTVRPFDPSILANFHQMEIQFSGQHSFAQYGQSIPQNNCSALTIPGLEGSTFSGSFPVSISDSIIADLGDFSTDGLTLDTLRASLGNQSSMGGGHCFCTDSTYIMIFENCFAYSQMELSHLPMLYARSDSIAFGLTGTVSQYHVAVQAGIGSTYTSGGCAACDFPGDSSVYTGTEWSTASVLVTFYR